MSEKARWREEKEGGRVDRFGKRRRGEGREREREREEGGGRGSEGGGRRERK